MLIYIILILSSIYMIYLLLFSYYTTSWGPCSKDCEGGEQTRLYYCKNNLTGNFVNNNFCYFNIKPSTNKKCNTKECITNDNLDKLFYGNSAYLEVPNTSYKSFYDNNIISCANKCNQEDGCKAYGLQKDEGKCDLYNNLESYDRNKYSNYVIGIKSNNDNPNEFDVNSFIDAETNIQRGELLSGWHNVDEKTCATQCQNLDKCVGYSYSPNKCMLYGEDGISCSRSKITDVNIISRCKKGSTLDKCLNPPDLNCEGEKEIKNICQNSILKLRCNNGGKIQIKDAFYGRTNSEICKDANISKNINTNCSKDVTEIVKQQCNDFIGCDISVNNSMFGDPCPDTSKYFNVKYSCEI